MARAKDSSLSTSQPHRRARAPAPMQVESVPLGSVLPDPANVRRHDARNVDAIKASLARYGQVTPIVVDAHGIVRKGNGTLEAARQLGWAEVKVVRTALSGVDATGYAIADNRTSDLSAFVEDDLARQLEALRSEPDFSIEAAGYTDAEVEALLERLSAEVIGALGGEAQTPRPSLAERFGVPPFSVLDARQGYWQDRKRRWIALGIRSEIGRGDNTLGLSAECEAYRDGEGDYARTFGPGGPGTLDEQRKAWREGHSASLKGGLTLGTTTDPIRVGGGKKDGTRAVTTQEWVQSKGLSGACAGQSGTSIFDPVLCELAYRWFCPEGGSVLDPFAGGSVRGVVAAQLGRRYTGIDLRAEQVAANVEQAAAIGGDPAPRWIVGDSRFVADLAPGAYDLVFSCPPYADLERYSDDPADLSTLDYPAFLAAYRAIVRACVGMLGADRFACFVVGDVRGPRGFYRNFVADTIAAFQDAGATLYNEAVLVTSVGSLPIRVGKQFAGHRKLGKTHQNVLVFFKGDPRRIAAEYGDVDVALDLEGGQVDPA